MMARRNSNWAEPTFRSSRILQQQIGTRVPYLVFVTPEGDQGMFVSQRSAAGFTVRAIGGGHSNVPFAYRVVANAASPIEDAGGFREVRETFYQPEAPLPACG